jgi:hypothetical protein
MERMGEETPLQLVRIALAQLAESAADLKSRNRCAFL